MIKFPVFESLNILNYGLFPGSGDLDPGLHVNFMPGLTLILGANGLGKTTLINIIYRMLTGPYDIPRLDKFELGTTRLEPTQMSKVRRKIFADRVVDGARTAKAYLNFRLGQNSVLIERCLNDLSLVRLEIDDRVVCTDEEKIYQEEITRLAGVSSFGDWILLLLYLVFYFEDRRALVWDQSAQRQILRMLFLPIDRARKWTEDERYILELDSRMRNFRAVLGRDEHELADNEKKVQTGVDVSKELAELEGLQETYTKLRERLESNLLEVDNARQKARLRMLNAEQEKETQYRSLERIKYRIIETRFPDRSETARYIIAQLLTDNNCLVCGSHVPKIADEYSDRIEHKQCVVCGSDNINEGRHFDISEDNSVQAIDLIVGNLNFSEKNLSEARCSLEEAEEYYQLHVKQLDELNKKIGDQSRRIDYLIRQLPPEEAKMHEQRSGIASLRSRVETLKTELESKRMLFTSFVEKVNRDIVKWKENINESFYRYAAGFLLEQCRLIWSPQKATVGQGGTPIDFPAFELDMTGATFPSLVRRSGPEQVSESQREFIDLAFRMALMSVAAEGESSSLVMDAPESSLDAVFTTRAADVLSRFADPVLNNRLVITSNLVEGGLIPSLIKKSTTFSDRKMRIVDLLKKAEPTAAIRTLKEDYEKVQKNVLDNLLADRDDYS